MGHSRIEGTTLNLSEHGMYMFTAADIALGSEIEIVFRPPRQKEPVQLSAIIRRKVVYLYGIEFLNNGSQPFEDRRFLESPDETALDSPDSKTGHPIDH